MLVYRCLILDALSGEEKWPMTGVGDVERILREEMGCLEELAKTGVVFGLSESEEHGDLSVISE